MEMMGQAIPIGWVSSFIPFLSIHSSKFYKRRTNDNHVQRVIHHTFGKVLEIPRDVWFHHIFDFLIGGEFHRTKRILKQVTFEHLMRFKNLDLELLFENLKSLHRFIFLVNKELSIKLVGNMNDEKNQMRCFEDSDHDMIDSYWLGAVSMIQVAWYFKKQQQLQKLQLVRGDLTPEQCLEIAKLQFIMISEERGEFSQYEDIVDSDSLVSGYVSKMDIETLQNETTMEEVKENFVRRISHLIITTEKFEKMKRKMPTLSSYELFMFRAQICCLDMMNDLYLKRGSTQVESCGEQFYVHEYNKGSSNWKSFFPFHSSKILKKLHPVEHLNNYLAVTITLRNYIHFGSTQFSQHLQFVEIELSLKSVDEIEKFAQNFLEHSIFPNVKYLTLKIDDDYYSDNFVESTMDSYKMFEKNVLSCLSRKTFPKLLHLVLENFECFEAIFQLEVINQLLSLYILGAKYEVITYEPIQIFKDSRIHNITRSLCLHSDDLMLQELTVQANIHPANGLTSSSLKEYYDLTRNSFVVNISQSSISDFYSCCYE